MKRLIIFLFVSLFLFTACVQPADQYDPEKSARDAKREMDINNLITAVEIYNADYGTYPKGGGCIGDDIFNTEDRYLYFSRGKVPKDPLGSRDNVKIDFNMCFYKGTYYYKNLEGKDGFEYAIATVMELNQHNNASDKIQTESYECKESNKCTFFVKVF